MVEVRGYVNYPPEIGRCFNSTMHDGGAGTPGCGYSVSVTEKTQTSAVYYVNFNFTVSGRFFLVNSTWAEQGVSASVNDSTSLTVIVKRLAGNTLTSAVDFTLIIF